MFIPFHKINILTNILIYFLQLIKFFSLFERMTARYRDFKATFSRFNKAWITGQYREMIQMINKLIQ